MQLTVPFGGGDCDQNVRIDAAKAECDTEKNKRKIKSNEHQMHSVARMSTAKNARRDKSTNFNNYVRCTISK